MSRPLPFRGTLLNAATVFVGGLLGVAAGAGLSDDLLSIALTGLGLVTIGMGLRLFFQSRQVLIVAAAIALGGVIGELVGIDSGLNAFAEWAKQGLGGQGRFSEAIVVTTVLFCIGPMTVLGCIQDGLEGKIELLSLKSLMDGIAAFFFAAALGPGVLVTAGVVLMVQGTLTAMAGFLKPIADDEGLLAELSGVGGPILLAIGLGLVEIKKIPSENFLPALILGPALVIATRRWTRSAKAATA